MEKISKEQKYLLKKIMRGVYPPSKVIREIWRFIHEKPEDEPIDPHFLDIWEEYRVKAHRHAPLGVIREIDEIMKSIPPPIDAKIKNIKINNENKVTFLLGAGASAPSGIPTVDKLLSELWKRARKIGREDLDRLAKWCEDLGITNIEDLLTAAYISNFAAKNRNVTALLGYFMFSGKHYLEEEEDYFITRRRPAVTSEIDVSSISFLQETLQTLFGLLTSTMISASPNSAHESIVNFIKKHRNTTIITTNYDGCMDEAILEAGLKIKRFGEDVDDNEVELIKMHGSINWAYCDSCQDVREFNLLKLKEIYENDDLSYPVLGICKNCRGLRRPLLVPPLSFKFLMFPNLIDVWNSARQNIEKADYLIVIGYSFSEADTYITKIISRSMSIKTSQKMIIVNSNSDIVPNLRERFSAHIERFDEERILKACGKCEEILPEILDSMLSKKDVKNEKKIS